MNKIFVFHTTTLLGILSLLLFVFVISNVSTADVAEETWMPDAKLRAKVRAVLKLKAGDALTQQAMTKIKVLKANNKEISSLTGLEHATKLKRLFLNANQISDITPLSGLTKLTRLDLKGNQISDITSLSGLTKLTRLDLKANQISDPTSLSGLTALTKLYLNGNPISDFAPLRTLKTQNPNIQIDIAIPAPNRAPLTVGTIPVHLWYSVVLLLL